MTPRFDRITQSHYVPVLHMVQARNGSFVPASEYLALAREAVTVVRALLAELDRLTSREPVH